MKRYNKNLVQGSFMASVWNIRLNHQILKAIKEYWQKSVPKCVRSAFDIKYLLICLFYYMFLLNQKLWLFH